MSRSSQTECKQCLQILELLNQTMSKLEAAEVDLQAVRDERAQMQSLNQYLGGHLADAESSSLVGGAAVKSAQVTESTDCEDLMTFEPVTEPSSVVEIIPDAALVPLPPPHKRSIKGDLSRIPLLSPSNKSVTKTTSDSTTTTTMNSIGKLEGDDMLRYNLAVKMGIFYVPAKEDVENRCTVHLEGVPASCNLYKILQDVSGGMLVSAAAHNMLWHDGTFTIRLIFVQGASARSFVRYHTKHPFTVIAGTSVVAVKTTLIASPTHPPNAFVSDAISRNNRTRILRISRLARNVHPNALIDILKNKHTKRHGILWLEIKKGDDKNRDDADTDTAIVEFDSVLSALGAFEKMTQALRRHVWFAKCVVSFARDGCDRPLPVVDEDSDDESDSSRADSGLGGLVVRRRKTKAREGILIDLS